MSPETKFEAPVEEIRLDADKLAERAVIAREFLESQRGLFGRQRKHAQALLAEIDYPTKEESDFHTLQAADKYITDKRIRLAKLSQAWGVLGRVGIPIASYALAIIFIPPSAGLVLLKVGVGIIGAGTAAWGINKLRLKRFEKRVNTTFNTQKPTPGTKK